MASLFRKALHKISLSEEEETDRWSNEDIRPVPPERQLWGKITMRVKRQRRSKILTCPWRMRVRVKADTLDLGPIQYVELWFCINLNMSSYQTGSSLLSSGLTFWQAIIVIVFGNAMATGFAVLNSVSGAKSHLGFPIVSRSVWGK